MLRLVDLFQFSEYQGPFKIFLFNILAYLIRMSGASIAAIVIICGTILAIVGVFVYFYLKKKKKLCFEKPNNTEDFEANRGLTDTTKIVTEEKANLS